MPGETLSGWSLELALAGPIAPAAGRLALGIGIPALGKVTTVGDVAVAELAGAVPVKTVTVPPASDVGVIDGAAAGVVVGSAVAAGIATGDAAPDATMEMASGGALPGITTVAGVGAGSSLVLLQAPSARTSDVAMPTPTSDDEAWVFVVTAIPWAA